MKDTSKCIKDTEKLILDNDNSLKTILERFYIIPKISHGAVPEVIYDYLQEHCLEVEENIINNGYLVVRGKKKKALTPEQVELIKNDTVHTQKELADIYGVGVATIGRVKQGIY